MLKVFERVQLVFELMSALVTVAAEVKEGHNTDLNETKPNVPVTPQVSVIYFRLRGSFFICYKVYDFRQHCKMYTSPP